MATQYLFDEPCFHDPELARQHLEAIRWPRGPVCPHCGACDRISKLNGKAHRPGVYECGHCRDQFTVTVGTVFERSKISLDKWLFAATLMASSKKGVSSKQIERMLGVTYKTAWFMTHRLREAMKPGNGGLLGSGSGTIEADETFIGRKPGTKIRRGHGHKEAVFSLVERVGQIEARQYTETGKDFAAHRSVNHSAEEYVRGDAHTNTVEGFFSIFKRGMYGVYQHCSSHHLHRYTTEFDFRYNHRQKLGFDDGMRTEALLKGIGGKRLTCLRTDAEA